MSTQKTADEKPKRGWWPFGGSSSSAGEGEVAAGPGITARKGRATPSRRNAEEDEEEGNVVVRRVGGVREYIEGVQSEINKVSWPTREETRRLSIIVLATTLIASLILGVITLAYSELFRIGVNQPIIFLAFFVGVLIVGFVLYRRANRSSGSTY